MRVPVAVPAKVPVLNLVFAGASPNQEGFPESSQMSEKRPELTETLSFDADQMEARTGFEPVNKGFADPPHGIVNQLKGKDNETCGTGLGTGVPAAFLRMDGDFAMIIEKAEFPKGSRAGRPLSPLTIAVKNLKVGDCIRVSVAESGQLYPRESATYAARRVHMKTRTAIIDGWLYVERLPDAPDGATS